MAYRFPQDDVLSDDVRIGQAVRSASITGFGPYEALAFWLGMRDGPETLRTGLIASWLEDLFAIRPNPPLADPRLEGIRRVTVALRHGLDRQAETEISRALAEGVTDRQIAALRSRLQAGDSAAQDAAA